MSKGYSNLFSGTSGSTAGVWQDISPTQENYPGTSLPRSFTINTGERTFWVHGNATEHMAEYLAKQASTGHSTESTRLATQLMLYDMQQSLAAVTQSSFTYGRVIKHGNWEFIIQHPRGSSPYDAVIHAFIRK